MANTKISQLPSWSGTAADLRWFVMNNSGESQTFKFSGYTSPFKEGSVANSIIANYLPASSGNANKALVGGGTTTYSNNDHSIVWGENCYINQNTQFANAVFGRGSRVTGGSGGSMVYGSDCNMTGAYSLVGGEQSNCYGNNTGVFGRGHQSYVGRGFVTGNVNNVTGDGDTCMGDQHSMNNGGTDTYNGLFGGRLNRLNNALWCSILGGYGNGLSGATSSSADYIYGAAIVGGSGHTLNGNFDFIAGGRNNRTKNNQPSVQSYNSIINGYSNDIGNNGGRNTNLSQIIGGYGNNAINNGSLSTIIGSSGSQTDGAASNMLIINSTSASMDGAAFSNIISSSSATLKSNGYSGIYNSSSCNIPGYSPYYSTIMGSSNSNVGQNYPNGGGNYKGLYNVEDSNVYGAGHHHAIFNGKNNTINSTGDYNSIINGFGNTIGNYSGNTMVGCFNRTADYNNTTYVENLRVFGQAKYGNYNNGNRGTSYTIDWNNGNIQKITLTANTTFSATNITDGTTYIFKVSQNASGNNTGTWTSSIFQFPNATPPTLSTGANAVDIFTFVAMDGVLYGVAQLNFG